MASIAYYRAEAERCQKLAEASKDPEAANRWRTLARDYRALADDLETSPSAPLVQHVPMRQQPVQQQQKKAEPDDKE
jgi:hypothetical protein